MVTLKHHVAGKGVRTREEALAAFWASHRASNGKRRQDPEEFIQVLQVREVRSETAGTGSWDIFYKVPSRVVSGMV